MTEILLQDTRQSQNWIRERRRKFHAVGSQAIFTPGMSARATTAQTASGSWNDSANKMSSHVRHYCPIPDRHLVRTRLVRIGTTSQ